MDGAAGSAGSDDVAIRIIDDDRPTGFPIDAIKDLVRTKNTENLGRLGGVAGITEALSSSRDWAISGDYRDIARRREVFGRNEYLKPMPNSFFKHMCHTIRDGGVIVILVRASVSLGYGIKNHGIQDGWYGAAPVLIAALLVAVVSAASTYSQAKRFNEVASKSGRRVVVVIRGGRMQEVPVFELVVGDVAKLKTGDVVPADGVFLCDSWRRGLLVNESSMTGEQRHVAIDSENAPFLISGAKVVGGTGYMPVTAVGKDTALGEMMGSTTCDCEKTGYHTPIQERLQDVKSIIGRVGSPLVDRKHTTIIVLLSAIVGVLLQAMAIPQSLLLGLMLMLSLTMKRMVEDGVLVRRVSACQTMASATAICTGKKGTVTLKQMEVTDLWVGTERIKAVGTLNDDVVTLMHQGAGLNTCGSVHKPDNASPPVISGTPTDKALLTWAVEHLGMDSEVLNRSSSLLLVEPFRSDKRHAGSLIRDNSIGAVTAHRKGAAEAVMANCSAYVDTDGASHELNANKRNKLEEIVSKMADAC